MNRYETVFIVTPVLSDAQMKEAVEKFRKFLKDSGAKMVNDDHWGLRKLAYPIQHKSTGFYHMFEYEAEGDVIHKLEIQIRRDERIIRFLTMKMDKYAIVYSEKKSKLKKQEKKEDK